LRGKKFWLRVVTGLLVATIVGYVGIIVVFAWYSKDLPTPNKVVRREGFASRIFDRNGKLLYDVYKDEKRNPVTWEEVSGNLKKATVAVEDKDFYNHRGFDPLTPLRIIKNIVVYHRLIGGSTLTQQLVKNVLLTSERSVNRKIREFILAVQIEARYKKDEILLMYLNEAPYGGADWGVGTACEHYFGKSPKDLTLAEAAILAGLPQMPNVYSPFSKTPKAYVGRTDHVLDRMVAMNYISMEEKVKTMEEVKNYNFRQNKTVITAPHFVFWVKDKLEERYGEEIVDGGGLRVTTTLDLEMQLEAEKIVKEEIDKAESRGISNGAAVILDPVTGEVLAMIGSRDYFSDKTDGNFNVVTQGLRQPGSAIKPVTYLTAIRRGWVASSLVMDTPVTFPGTGGQKDYSPQNYNGKFNGPMSLGGALGNSINTVAVKMLANVGLTNMLQQAADMGLSTLEPTPENLRRFGLAVTLGGAEVKMIDLASAYSAFANGGKKVEATGVLKVEDRGGKVLEEFRPVPGKQVASPQEVFIISNILADNSMREITFGAVNGLTIPNYQVAVKTGTTNDKRDNWCIGWTPNLLVATWVGNNDNSPMLKVASGVSGASPIWKRITQSVLPRRPKQDFPIPESIVNVEVDRVSGYPAHDGFPSRGSYFIEGTTPKTADPIHLKLRVCRGQGGLAPPEDVANGNYEEKEYFRFREEDKVSADGKNRWQEGIDAWINQQTDRSKYEPPESYCRQDGRLVVNFDSPSDRSTVGNEVTIRLGTSSLKKITEAKLWINGEEKKTWTEKPFEINLKLDDNLYTLKAKVADKDGNIAEREIKIGVNKPWDWMPSPTPTPTPMPTSTPVPTVTVVPTVVPTGIGST
jgi:penicillin-binding protein 1C